MEVNRDEEKKVMEVWLTREESQDEALHNRLKPLCAKWKKQKYLVAVYRSGVEDLYRNTLDLLSYNKKRCAELAVLKDKEHYAKVLAQTE